MTHRANQAVSLKLTILQAAWAGPCLDVDLSYHHVLGRTPLTLSATSLTFCSLHLWAPLAEAELSRGT
eukprot:2627243-Amphidinium_carterae.1